MKNLLRTAMIDDEPLVLGLHRAMDTGSPVSRADATDNIESDAEIPSVLKIPDSTAVVTESTAPEYLAGTNDAETQPVEADSHAANEVIEMACEAARKQGQEEGYADGFESGKNAAISVWNEKLAELEQIIGQIRLNLGNKLNGLEDIVTEITFEAVAKLLGDAMATQEGARAVVVNVMGHIKDSAISALRLNPTDFELLSRADFILTIRNSHPGIKIIADESIEYGGCVIESSTGSLNGRLEVQVERLRNVFLEARSRRKADSQDSI